MSALGDNWRALQRKRDAEPAALVEAIYKVASAMLAAEAAIENFYGYELRLMSKDRAAQFEAIFPDTPPYFEIEPFAKAIQRFASKWQDELDAEIS